MDFAAHGIGYLLASRQVFLVRGSARLSPDLDLANSGAHLRSRSCLWIWLLIVLITALFDFVVCGFAALLISSWPDILIVDRWLLLLAFLSSLKMAGSAQIRGWNPRVTLAAAATAA